MSLRWRSSGHGAIPGWRKNVRLGDLAAKPNQPPTTESKEKSALVPTGKTRTGKLLSLDVGDPQHDNSKQTAEQARRSRRCVSRPEHGQGKYDRQPKGQSPQRGSRTLSVKHFASRIDSNSRGMSEAPPSCEPDFDEVRKDCIHQQHGGHQRPVGPRQGHETQGSSSPSEGQRHADRTNDDRRRN